MAVTRLTPAAVLPGILALALVLSACATPGAPTPTGTVVTTAPTPTATDAGAATPTTSPTTVPEATCDSLVAEDILTDLTAKGWTFEEAPFTAGDLTLDDGLQCTWADFSVASGNLFLFGWAPITADEAQQAQDQLVAQGWTIEDAEDGGLYVTEDGTRAPTVDENGYGMTYEFGGGWVTIADTKQNLLLIERPQG